MRLAVTGGSATNHSDATHACQAGRSASRTSRQINSAAVATFSTSSGSFRAKTVGPSHRNSGAAIQACTPSM